MRLLRRSTPRMTLPGKVFVVTGGASGIGREVVLQLLDRGASVAAVDLRADGLAQTAERAAARADKLSTHALDITDRAAVEALPDAVVQAHGQIDGLLNIAGIIQHFVPFMKLEHDEIARVMDVNFWGVVNTCQAFLPHLVDRPEARLLNVSSMGSFAPVPGQTIYGASKAAVTLLTEGLYAELRSTPVQVTVVFPGAIATDIATNSGAALPGQDLESATASAPKMTSADDAARALIDGLETGAFRVVIGKDAAALDKLARLSPKKATDLIAKKMASLLQR